MTTRKKILAEKQAQFEAQTAAIQAVKPAEDKGGFPEGAQLCKKCMTKAMILMDNCMTCLNCGESKCG